VDSVGSLFWLWRRWAGALFAWFILGFGAQRPRPIENSSTGFPMQNQLFCDEKNRKE